MTDSKWNDTCTMVLLLALLVALTSMQRIACNADVQRTTEREETVRQCVAQGMEPEECRE